MIEKEDRWILLWLNYNWKISNRRIIEAVRRAGGLRSLYASSQHDLEFEFGFTKSQALILSELRDEGRFREDEKRFERNNIQIISYWDEGYPGVLKNIYDPPTLLYLRGDAGLIGNKCRIALVGTRKPSEAGRRIAHKFSGELSREGIGIVSGMAIGIDRFAHMGGMEGKGKSIAVLASGIDLCYPLQNIDIYEEMAQNGLLISEFYPGTKPIGLNFVRRNRIISGLSEGVLVVESGERSGSLITANYGLEQGKTIMAVPGAINNPMSRGCNNLIKSGAALIDSVEAILEEISFKGQLTIDIDGLMRGGISEKEKSNREVADLDSVMEKYDVVIDAISINQPIAIDGLYLITGMEMVNLISCVVKLIEKGLVAVDKRGKYYLT